MSQFHTHKKGNLVRHFVSLSSHWKTAAQFYCLFIAKESETGEEVELSLRDWVTPCLPNLLVTPLTPWTPSLPPQWKLREYAERGGKIRIRLQTLRLWNRADPSAALCEHAYLLTLACERPIKHANKTFFLMGCHWSTAKGWLFVYIIYQSNYSSRNFKVNNT